MDERPPAENVVIFDEAQRAWNLSQTARFMQRKRKRPGFSQSEPEFLISYMDRHPEWAVIICLVGGGREIHTGEAGIDAWLEAISTAFPGWEMYISSRLTDSEYAAGRVSELVAKRPHTHFDDSLHLAVPMRSFRAENVSAFVKDEVGTVLGRASYERAVEALGAAGFLLDDQERIEETLGAARAAARAGRPAVVNALIGSSEFRKGSTRCRGPPARRGSDSARSVHILSKKYS